MTMVLSDIAQTPAGRFVHRSHHLSFFNTIPMSQPHASVRLYFFKRMDSQGQSSGVNRG